MCGLWGLLRILKAEGQVHVPPHFRDWKTESKGLAQVLQVEQGRDDRLHRAGVGSAAWRVTGRLGGLVCLQLPAELERVAGPCWSRAQVCVARLTSALAHSLQHTSHLQGQPGWSSGPGA